MVFVLEEGKPVDVSTRDNNEVGVYQALDLLSISSLFFAFLLLDVLIIIQYPWASPRPILPLN